MSRREEPAFHLQGTPEADGYKNIITGIIEVEQLSRLAKEHKSTLTAFLTSVMMKAICNIQERKIPKQSRRKAVKILLPVNLRKFFNSNTLRNFVLYITPGIDPALGEYTLEEIIKSVQAQMNYELTAKLIKKNAHPLYAPINGAMNRIIHESASCIAYYKFSRKGKLLCEFTSDRASFEFEYTRL